MRIQHFDKRGIERTLAYMREEYRKLISEASRGLAKEPPRNPQVNDAYCSGGKIYVYGPDGWDTYSKD